MNAKPFAVMLVRRLQGKTYSVEERIAGTDIWCPITLLTEIAIEKKRFRAFTDMKTGGWQHKPDDTKWEYALVELYDEDSGSDDDDEDPA